MNPKKFIVSLLLLTLSAPAIYAPSKDKTLAVRFYDIVNGSPAEKCSAYWGFLKWTKHFKHPRQEIYNLIQRESNFQVKSKSIKGAYGLMQCRTPAFKSIAPPPDGKRFFKVIINPTNKCKRMVINEYYALRPYYNIYAGCAYYRICKRMAKAQTVGRFKFTQREMAKIYYIAGFGNWLYQIKPTLKYIQQKGGEL